MVTLFIMQAIKAVELLLWWFYYNIWILLIIACPIIISLDRFNIYPVDDYFIFLTFCGFPVFAVMWKIGVVERKLDKLTQ